MSVDYIPSVVREKNFVVPATHDEYRRAELTVRGIHRCDGGTAPCVADCRVILGTAIPGYRPRWLDEDDDLEHAEMTWQDYPATGLEIPLDLVPSVIAAMAEMAAPPSEEEVARRRAEPLPWQRKTK